MKDDKLNILLKISKNSVQYFTGISPDGFAPVEITVRIDEVFRSDVYAMDYTSHRIKGKGETDAEALADTCTNLAEWLNDRKFAHRLLKTGGGAYVWTEETPARIKYKPGHDAFASTLETYFKEHLRIDYV